MEKLKIHSFLKVTGDSECTVENTYKGTHKNDKILYHEGNIAVCLTVLDDTVSMNRKTEEYEIEMTFSENETKPGIYDLIEMNAQMELQVKTNHLKIEKGLVEIIYDLTINGEMTGTYDFTLEYEEIV